MSTRKTITFILNPISGTVKKAGIPDLISSTLDASRFEHRIVWTEYAGHASVIAHEERERGTDVVVAVGGDGTVNEVGRSLVDSPTAMAILPCGSGNGLARHLMLPMDIEKSLKVINRCEIHRLDYGIINDHPFFCTCGMGFDAFISQKFAEAGKRGKVTYIENVLKEGLTYKPETYRIEDENGTTLHKAFLISCANASQYGNNAYIAPQASMSDGQWLEGSLKANSLTPSPDSVASIPRRYATPNAPLLTGICPSEPCPRSIARLCRIAFSAKNT